MKKIILLVVIISISIITNAQQKDTYIRNSPYGGYLLTLSADSAYTFAKMITSVTKRKFTIKSVPTHSDLANNYSFGFVSDYVLTSDEIRDQRYYEYSQYIGGKKYIVMSVDYVEGRMGANADLEIKGIPYYEFTQVTGAFLDIFPIWKKFFNPNADMNDCLKYVPNFGEQGDKITIINSYGNNVYKLYKSKSDTWIIQRTNE